MAIDFVTCYVLFVAVPYYLRGFSVSAENHLFRHSVSGLAAILHVVFSPWPVTTMLMGLLLAGLYDVCFFKRPT
jgi:hypothetical protein